jgi:hypothetical protein
LLRQKKKKVSKKEEEQFQKKELEIVVRPNPKRTLKIRRSALSPPLSTGGRRNPAMAASSPPPPPPQSLSAGGGAHISLFLDTDLGTHLALNVAADSTIRCLKCTSLVASPPLISTEPSLTLFLPPLRSAQVSVEHAAAFPDLGTVSVKSFQVLIYTCEV